MVQDEYSILYEYYANKKIGKLKSDIKHEKNMFRKQMLQDIYNQLKRNKDK